MSDILLVNGPNLNLLGTRDPGIYGSTTLADIETRAARRAEQRELSLDNVQSNHEGALIDAIQDRQSRGIIVNAGGLSHTSVSLRDALSDSGAAVVEVHISNIFAREDFRHHSYISPIAQAIICGAGPRGYEAAVDILADTV